MQEALLSEIHPYLELDKTNLKVFLSKKKMKNNKEDG